MKAALKPQLRYLLALAGIFLVGAGLRLYLLSSQILLDDEWHSLKVVPGAHYAELLTRFNPWDNTSPLFNLYDLALYQNFGWSEFSLRLPVILAGLASLILLPIWVRKILGGRVALIFAGLLAISPFLIFYSRYVRAYGLVALLGFSALLSASQWLKTGWLRYAAGYVFMGALAVYAHLFALVAVLLPLALGFGFACFRRSQSTSAAGRRIAVSSGTLGLVAGVMLALLLPLLWPVWLQSAGLPWQKGHLTLPGILTAGSLLAGTVNGPLLGLFFLSVLGGLGLLFRRDPLLGWMFLTTPCAYLLVLLASRPIGLDDGAVMLRYMIVVVPMSLTLVALAMDHLLHRLPAKGISRRLAIPCVAGALGIYYAAGPLPAMYQAPNNFTNHSAYQGSYRRHTWEFAEAHGVYPAYPAGTNAVPAFYFRLQDQPDCDTIIEYPFDVCDYNNLLYYYQHFHKKRVLAGYTCDPRLLDVKWPASPSEPEFNVGYQTADGYLCAVADSGKLAFRNLVDITKPAAVLGSHAGCLVLHKYIMGLKIVSRPLAPQPVYGSIPIYYHSVEVLKPAFARGLGPPVYEDEQIVCFRIAPPAGENHAAPPPR